MQEKTLSDHDPAVNEESNGAGCLTRIYWMFAGNALLAMLLVWLIFNHPKFPSLQDAGYVLTLASLVAVRYIDIRHFKGENGAGGTRCTLADWQKYSLFLVSGGVAAWLAVRFLFPLLVN